MWQWLVPLLGRVLQPQCQGFKHAIADADADIDADNDADATMPRFHTSYFRDHCH